MILFYTKAFVLFCSFTASLSMLDGYMRNNKTAAMYMSPVTSSDKIATVESNSLLRVNAAATSWYKVTLTNGRKGFISSAALTSARRL